MASQPCDLFALISELRESARRGDWRNAFELAIALRDHTPPANTIADGEYLERLRGTLEVAKASRAQTAATLVRLRAAAGFNRFRGGEGRQDFGESADL
jgi:hypothetical protein